MLLRQISFCAKGLTISIKLSHMSKEIYGKNPLGICQMQFFLESNISHPETLIRQTLISVR